MFCVQQIPANSHQKLCNICQQQLVFSTQHLGVLQLSFSPQQPLQRQMVTNCSQTILNENLNVSSTLKVKVKVLFVTL